MLQTIYGFAEEKNCLIGITDPYPIPSLKERLDQTETPFVSGSIERRLYPDVYLPGVKSIIALGVPCAPACNESSSILAAPGEPYTGLISSMAISRDYHQAVKGLLNELAGRIQPMKYKIFADSGGLVEREWAVKAGLGFWGKNCCVISPSKGSFFNIGLLLTDLELPVSQAKKAQNCGDCSMCIDACPGKALTPYRLNYSCCVSYITQKDGALTDAERSIMERWVYGCDICQQVCPYNKRAAFYAVSLPILMNMTEEGFLRACGSTVMRWRGLGILKRNAFSVFKTVYNWG